MIGVDQDREKIEQLRRRIPPFYELGLQELIDEGMDGGRLTFAFHAGSGASDTAVIFVCVGTPARASGEANLVAVEDAARSVARHLSGPVTVVEKSTVPAGTASRIRQVLSHERPDLSDAIEVVSNPEFLREGQAVHDALQPDRILVGATSERGFETMRRLYEPLVRRGHGSSRRTSPPRSWPSTRPTRSWH